MNTRHQTNKNLTTFTGDTYYDFPLYKHTTFIEPYLNKTFQVIESAVQEHSKVMIIRVDLHLPHRPNCRDYPVPYDGSVISKFTASLNAQLKADLQKKNRMGGRVHNCPVRYVWVKETATVPQEHYHVVLCLNNHAYSHLGNVNDAKTGSDNNLVGKIIKAWASALSLYPHEAGNLVHIPSDNPVYYLNKHNSSYAYELARVYKRVSYLAKAKTKNYSNYSHSFGSSRC
jgi:hypothetical protein